MLLYHLGLNLELLLLYGIELLANKWEIINIPCFLLHYTPILIKIQYIRCNMFTTKISLYPTTYFIITQSRWDDLEEVYLFTFGPHQIHYHKVQVIN